MMMMFQSQRGGLFLGLMVGLLVGLGAALAVALYVTKVPVPFMNSKGGPKPNNAEQDAEEAKKNKNWDPNAPLYGKNPGKPNPVTLGTGAATSGSAPGAAPTGGILPPVAATPETAASKPAAPKISSADPLGDLAKARAAGASAPGSTTAAANTTSAGPDPFTYFVQAGAFSSPEDAEAQKAKLGMAGFEATITEREQAGRTVFRVRVGPLQSKERADNVKEKLDGSGFETAIVRVQR
jgi:cell division protein FtsN